MSSNAMSAGPGPIIPIREFQESPSTMRGPVLEVRPGLAECLSETFNPLTVPVKTLGGTLVEATAIDV